MSNMGLEAALKRGGIRMLRAAVGDKYVLEEMIKTGATLGGEQSGHILFRDMDTTTGDGILTALRVLEVVARARKPLAELVADMKVFPQRIENVNVREKVPMDQLPPVMETIRARNSNSMAMVAWWRYWALKAGARHGGSRIGGSDRAAREDDCECAAEGDRVVRKCFDRERNRY